MLYEQPRNQRGTHSSRMHGDLGRRDVSARLRLQHAVADVVKQLRGHVLELRFRELDDGGEPRDRRCSESSQRQRALNWSNSSCACTRNSNRKS
jgi:hypothetical protein